MKKYFFFAAVAILALASCADNEYVGDVSPNQNPGTNSSDAIVFSSGTKGITRADIYGPSAATLLGNNFYVMGTKGSETETTPTQTLVFDNYLVHYGNNTAGTTESNTANWEYVGIQPGAGAYTDYTFLSSLTTPRTADLQTIKYWDYSTDQYDFLAFSTGTFKAVSGTSGGDDQIGVTAMKYGADLTSGAVAYTFDIPSAAAIKQAYITDITEVVKANYGQEVTLRFKNLGSKVRVALYETVPGYSIEASSVKFYTTDGTSTDLGATSTNATLISADDHGLPTKGTINVIFPHVGTNYQPGATNAAEDYNKASATVSPVGASSVKTLGFGALSNKADKDGKETAGELYLGRTLPAATFAGDAIGETFASSVDADYYQTVFPVSTSSALTLRVDYTLVSTDGSGETINVYGAKAVVPATYTVWLPNYAYTYIFKISDNTNGWTTQTVTSDTPAGLFPITFDAVVAEATDATGEQTTITTVATPTITTYQQGHTYATNEYSKSTGKNIYVQVMDNSAVPATLVTTLSATNSLLYAVDASHAANATEAQVMDALEKRTTELTADDVTGRNGITLTKDATNISNTVTSIVNGVDNNPITVASGSAAQITITGTGSLAAGTYAYVYDYSGTKTEINEFQPVDLSSSTVGTAGDGKSYYSLAKADLLTIVNAASPDPTNFTTGSEKKTDTDFYNYIYFSVTTNGTSNKTLSYVSVAGKDTLPAGLLKVAKSSITTSVAAGTSVNSADIAANFYFEKYITNNGKYAVKVIKVI